MIILLKKADKDEESGESKRDTCSYTRQIIDTRGGLEEV